MNSSENSVAINIFERFCSYVRDGEDLEPDRIGLEFPLQLRRSSHLQNTRTMSRKNIDGRVMIYLGLKHIRTVPTNLVGEQSRRNMRIPGLTVSFVIFSSYFVAFSPRIVQSTHACASIYSVTIFCSYFPCEVSKLENSSAAAPFVLMGSNFSR